MSTHLVEDITDKEWDIKEIDNIVAIEILADTYKIDCVKYDKRQLRQMIELLNLAIQNTAIPEQKNENTSA